MSRIGEAPEFHLIVLSFLLLAVGGCAGEDRDQVAHDRLDPPAEGASEPEVRGPAWSLEAPIYTQRQAEHGARIFGTVCSTCHALEDFTSSMFHREWGGGSVWSLYGFVRSAMPQNNPGGLRPEEYAAVVSFIFRENGLPAGQAELAPDEAELRALRLELLGDF